MEFQRIHLSSQLLVENLCIEDVYEVAGLFVLPFFHLDRLTASTADSWPHIYSPLIAVIAIIWLGNCHFLSLPYCLYLIPCEMRSGSLQPLHLSISSHHRTVFCVPNFLPAFKSSLWKAYFVTKDCSTNMFVSPSAPRTIAGLNKRCPHMFCTPCQKGGSLCLVNTTIAACPKLPGPFKAVSLPQ